MGCGYCVYFLAVEERGKHAVKHTFPVKLTHNNKSWKKEREIQIKAVKFYDGKSRVHFWIRFGGFGYVWSILSYRLYSARLPHPKAATQLCKGEKGLPPPASLHVTCPYFTFEAWRKCTSCMFWLPYHKQVIGEWTELCLCLPTCWLALLARCKGEACCTIIMDKESYLSHPSPLSQGKRHNCDLDKTLLVSKAICHALCMAEHQGSVLAHHCYSINTLD